MSSATVRVSAPVHEKLKRIATRSGMTLSRALEMAVEALRRQMLLEETNRAYAALRSDTKRWAEEQKERAAWETTLADGLEEP
jgi:predicted transcriptional regulator